MGVTCRVWDERDEQWKYLGFDCMEDLEEFETDTGIKLYNIKQDNKEEA